MKSKTSPDPKLSFIDKLMSYLENRQPSDRLFVYLLGLVVLVSAGYVAFNYNQSKLENIPEVGGELVEGIVGTPRFVNPVLAITRADSDLVALMYSGLMKTDADGNLIPDLAESVSESDDGYTYNIVLKENAKFHDGKTVTAQDVAYTIGLIQNADLKSPLRGNWAGVSIEVISDLELNLVLESPYSPFLENLTLGILPKHVWDQLSIEELPFSQNNTEPIGSGPYQLASVHRTNAGLIDSYSLKAFDQGGEIPNITDFKIVFYQNEDELLTALEANQISSTASLSIENLKPTEKMGFETISTPLPRVFTVFFNQNKSVVLRDKAVRQALAVMLDRQEIVDDVLSGYGHPTATLIPNGFGPQELSEENATSTILADRITEASSILKAGGWTKTDEGHWQKDIDKNVTDLAFTLGTANTDLFTNTAESLKETWEQLGVEVSVERFEQVDLVQVAIRPRDFDALLFGTDVGRSLDFYPFWHSSQREDPGLNISAYANITVDKLLEQLRTELSQDDRLTGLEKLQKEITDDVPALFLYTPSFTYVIKDTVMPVTTNRLTKPSERFGTISQWYMNEDRVWPIFNKTNN